MKKIIIITGGSNGIGLELTKILNKEEYNIISLSRSFGIDLVSEDGVYKLHCDITNENSVNEAFDKIYSEFNKVDYLINCAGSGVMGSIEDLSMEDVSNQLNIGIIGPLNLIKKVVPVMRSSNSGRIINVTASGGRAYFPGLPLYVASKLALDYLSEQLYREVKQFGISVAVVELGPVKSNFGKSIKRVESSNSLYKTYYKNVSSGYYKMFKSRAKTSTFAANLIFKAMLGSKFRYNSSPFDLIWIFTSKLLPISWYRKLINLRFQ